MQATIIIKIDIILRILQILHPFYYYTIHMHIMLYLEGDSRFTNQYKHCLRSTSMASKHISRIKTAKRRDDEKKKAKREEEEEEATEEKQKHRAPIHFCILISHKL